MSNFNNDSLFEEVHLYLCDHVSRPKIMERVQTIKEQLKRDTDKIPVDDVLRIQPYSCEVCCNTNHRTMVTDEQMGIMICLGPDGAGCGGVVQENMMRQQEVFFMDEDMCANELFSPQYETTSRWVKGNTLFKRLNTQIERDLVKYNRDDTLTSDLYKDKQRKDVYSMLDEVAIHTHVDVDTVKRVKLLFHKYRSKMYRVHKVEVALVALFYIVLCMN